MASNNSPWGNSTKAEADSTTRIYTHKDGTTTTSTQYPRTLYEMQSKPTPENTFRPESQYKNGVWQNQEPDCKLCKNKY